MSSPCSLILALAQMRVIGGDKAGNLARARAWIEEAADKGADLVLLPETLDLGWAHPSALDEAEPIPEGWPCRELAATARKRGIFVVAGLTERDKAVESYNTAVILDRRGDLVGRHRKVNELDAGREYYMPGSGVAAVDTELGRLGLMVCADGFARNLWIGRALGELGVDLILSPSAWAVDADHDDEVQPYGDLWRRSYRPVCEEFGIWIAAVSSVGELSSGPWQGKFCIGSSLVIDPEGNEVIRGPHGRDAESLILLKIDLPEHSEEAAWDEGMDDGSFLDAFESTRLPYAHWNHRSHLRIAYLYAARLGFSEGLARLRQGILVYNHAKGIEPKSSAGYHETLTQAWFRLVFAAIQQGQGWRSAGAFLQAQPQLWEKRSIHFFYSRERMMTPQARDSFVEPDLAPLPDLAKPS